MIVTWAARARRDLDDIHAYIARRDSPARATAVLSNLFAATDQLVNFPHIGRPGAKPGTRELVVSPYILPYRVRAQQVVILRVIHGARQRT